MTALDPRLNAVRPDLADVRLKGAVEAARFVEGTGKRVVAFAAPLKRAPRTDASLDSEVLRGEVFRVFDETAEGWSWGQLETDSYVGYVPTAALGDLAPEPTHRVTALRSFVYPGADLKLPAIGVVSLECRLVLAGETVTRGMPYLNLAGGEGAVVAAHVAPLVAPRAEDFVATAERFVETPYLWGGRTGAGLDCSSLLQLSLMACGHAAPRDTDLQEEMLGRPVEGGVGARLARGDLVFWPGHVGILVDASHMVHASGHHMTVVVEPLAKAVERIASKHAPPSSVRRLDV